MKKIKVLSLFDGISVAQQALKELGYDVEYYASEIDKYAISITQKNHPETKQIGSVTEVFTSWSTKDGLHLQGDTVGEIDLLIGGSPCQDLSIAKKNRQGLDGARSGLFWEYVRILKEVKPKYFVLENVNSMPKEAKAIITEALGVEPIMINAALVSAQNRKRLFWTNIPNVTLREDRNILLKDILEDGAIPERTKSNTIRTSGRGSGLGDKHNWDIIKVLQWRRSYWREMSDKEKSPTLTSTMGTGGGNVPFVDNGSDRRKLSIIECERLQSLPDNYTEGISNSQRYKCLGNAFNKEVVKHILKNL